MVHVATHIRRTGLTRAKNVEKWALWLGLPLLLLLLCLTAGLVNYSPVRKGVSARPEITKPAEPVRRATPPALPAPAPVDQRHPLSGDLSLQPTGLTS